jgi:predicted ATPase/DNA-binding SARP family transcriptional activator
VVLIRLLGGVSATDRGEPIDVGPAKCQTVLAVLALAAGSAVPVPRLIDLVWAEQPPRTADKTLQSYVVRLRKGLGAAAIVRVGAAYRLDLPPEAIDVTRFQQRLDSGDIEGALAEWAGTPLAGLEGHGLTPTVDGLIEQWLAAVETALQRRLQSDPASVIGPLTALTATHPFRENLWSLLMTALYRMGRQADALDTFRKARHQLIEELGVEPGPRLRELESLILGHDKQLRGLEAPTDPTSGRPAGTVTFGFGEVEGWSGLWSAHRKKMATAVIRLDEMVRAAVGRYHGYVFTAGGEIYGAAFHRADDAAAWAQELQLEVTSEPWPGGVELRLRIGLHAGETEERAGSYFGPAVNAAARIASSGHGRQILASEVTAALLDRSDLLDLGTYRLEGESSPLRILQLDEGRYPALRIDTLPRGNLPLRLERLIGREPELDAVREAFTYAPIVTLVGPGGIGKTRLALSVAMAQVDRAAEAWLVELANITASSDVPRAVAEVFDVKEGRGRPLTESIITALQSLSGLLVLDNCEHVIDGAAELAQALGQRCPDLLVLATSREALGVGGEQVIAVGPLDPAQAGVELFDERAHAVSAAFDAAAWRDIVVEICRRVDGIPLAIELAAAHAKTLTPDDVLKRLDQRLAVLTGGRRTSPDRHRTLRATIQWSYDLLTPAQKTLFQRLTVFAGPFDRAAASALVAHEDLDGAEVDVLLENLVEKSMLTVESGPFGLRFRLLETIGQYAADQLQDSGLSDRMAARHAQWCLQGVTDLHHLLIGPAEIEGVTRLGQLWPDLRAAFTWACTQGDHRLAAALVHPVAAELNLRQQSEIRIWVERILAITPAVDEDKIVYWITCATYGYKQNGDHAAYERLIHRYGRPDHPLVRYTRAYFYDDAEALRGDAVEAVAWFRNHGENGGAVHAEIAGVASALMSTGRFIELDAFVSALVTRYRAQGPPTLLYVTLAMLGYSAWFQGRAEEAERLFDETASIEVPAGTSSVNEPAQARKAFNSGHQSQAFRILHAYVQDLLATGYTDLARLAAVEFINILTAIGHLSEAAPILSYLAGTGDFGTLAVHALVADAAATIEVNAPQADSAQLDPTSMDVTRWNTCATSSTDLSTISSMIPRSRGRSKIKVVSEQVTRTREIGFDFSSVDSRARQNKRRSHARAPGDT